MPFRVNDLVGRVVPFDPADFEDCGEVSQQRCTAPSCHETKTTGSIACAGGTQGCAVPAGELQIGNVKMQLAVLLGTE